MNSMQQSNLVSKLMRFFTAIFCVMLVTACGGGGGSPGNTTNTPLFTTAPGSLLISPGETKTYTISGGVTSYKATSSAGSVVVSVVGNQLSITGGGGGGATVIVSDGVGATLSIDVKIGSGLPLFTTAGSSLAIAVGATSSVFEISGGSQNYAISSSNTGVATVGISGNGFIINGEASGKATITVRDSVGSTVSIDVLVGSSTVLYTSAGPDIALPVGASQNYLIGGGIPPYAAATNNAAIVVASVSGTTLAIRGNTSGSAIVNVTDASGASTKITVTVGSALAVTPAAPTGNAGDTLTFTIFGGTPGYTVSSNNPTIATVEPTTVSASTGTFTAKLLTAGSTTLSIVDKAGQTTSVALSVTSVTTVLRLSPDALLISERNNEAIVLTVFGGTPPYRAFTSNPSLAPVDSGSGTAVVSDSRGIYSLTIKPSATDRCVAANSSVTITLLDSFGSSATSTLSIADNPTASCP